MVKKMHQLREQWQGEHTTLSFESWLAEQLRLAEVDRDRYFQRLTYASVLLNKLVGRIQDRALGHLLGDSFGGKVLNFLSKGYISPDDMPDDKPFTFDSLQTNMLLWSEDRTYFILVERQDGNGNWLTWHYKWGANDKPFRDAIYPSTDLAKTPPVSEKVIYGKWLWLPWNVLYPEQFAVWLKDPALQSRYGSFGEALLHFGIRLRD